MALGTITHSWGTHTFETQAQLVEWLDVEIQSFQWLNNFAPGVKLMGGFGQLTVLKKQARQEPADNAAIANICDQLTKAYAEKRLLHSNDPKFRALEPFSKSAEKVDKVCATHMLQCFLRPHYDHDNAPPPSIGTIRAIMFEQGIDRDLKSEDSAFIGFISECSKRFDELVTVFANQSKQQDETYAKSSKHWHEQVAVGEAKQAEWQNRFDELHALYHQHLKIAAPVAYWKARQTDHREAKRTWGIAAACWGVAALLIFGLTWKLSWPAFTEAATQAATADGSAPADTAATDNAPAYALLAHHLGLLAVTATAVLWTARILVRSYLTHLHLENDAAERAVMAETYLALVNDGKVGDQDRQLVLQALFRHAQDGLVKDDAAPMLSLAPLKLTN